MPRDLNSRPPITRTTPTLPTTLPVSSGIQRGTSGRVFSYEAPYTGGSSIPTSGEISAGIKNPLYAAFPFLNPSGGNTGQGIGTDPNVTSPFYGSDNPFEILGDAFLRAFGGSTYNPPRESERTVVESAGGGSSGIVILLILGAIGVGVYYFYFRKKG